MTNRTPAARHRVALTSARAVRISALVSVMGLLGIATALAATTTTIRTWKSPRYGRILDGPARYTLYVWCSGTQSYCPNTHSARGWPPMIAHGKVVAAAHSGLNSRKLGTRKLRNGERQVTYYGEPLYLDNADKRPCQVHGEEQQSGGGSFFVVDTSGRAEPTPCYPGDPVCAPVCGK